MNNLDYWNAMNRPPERALKTIGGGRLKGMTDINPQWRYEVMTDTFGPCGIGWKYEIADHWEHHRDTGECAVFVRVNLYIKHEGEWSDAIPGTGGSMVVASETSGLRLSDEAYKMATTDALSVAMKALGVAADIYAGLWDGSKYKTAGQGSVPLGKQKIDADKVAKAVKWLKEQIDLDDLDSTAAHIESSMDRLNKAETMQVRGLLEGKAPGAQKKYLTLLDEHLRYARDKRLGLLPETGAENV